jgi:hypothetical protein
MSTEDELRDILDGTAGEITRLSRNPRTWNTWLQYLLERLEERANNENTSHRDSFHEMLAALENTIRNRRRTGGW